MIVIACPGQGAQKQGFLSPWLEEAYARDWLGEVGERVGIDLIRHGTESDDETIKNTRIAQPLIVASGILVIHQLYKLMGHDNSDLNGRLPERADQRLGFAGHSVGEITAAAAAGVFTAPEAINFVKHRAEFMSDASEQAASGMAAVLGDNSEAVAERYRLFPANYNGSGQVVFAGDKDNIAFMAANPPARTKVIPLKVAGAFHTRYMLPAKERLKKLSFPASDPLVSIWTNCDGSVVSSGKEYVQLLIEQITNSVRWDLCQENFAGSRCLVEVAPAGTLANLAKRAVPGVPTLAINTPDDLEAVRQYLN